MPNAVIYQRISPANANQVLKAMARSCARISTSAPGRDHAASTPTVSTCPATIPAPAEKDLKEIHMMDASTTTSALIRTLAVLAQSVQTSRVVIAATAQKVSTEMHDRPAVSTTTSARDRHVEEMQTVLMRWEHSGASALRDSKAIR